MKETFYFTHDYNAHTDEKILKLRRVLGMEGYGIYWCILEKLASNNGVLSLSGIDDIAYDLHIDNSVITSVITEYNLFICDIENDLFYNKRLSEHLGIREEIKNKKSEAGKKGMAKRWEKNNTVITENNTVITNDNKGKESKVKESKKKEINNISNDILETSKEVSDDLEKNIEVFGKEEINKMQKIIKETIEKNGMIYKPGKHERGRIKNIVSGKEFGKVCENVGMSREVFVINIINLASKLKYSKKINNGVDLYENYAAVYNTALLTKNNLLEVKGNIGHKTGIVLVDDNF